MKEEIIMNIDWLDDFLRLLPEVSKVRRNFMEIAGFPKWETVNSNLLAFYLDKTAEHGFGDLFFKSLLKLINQEDNELYKSDYYVEREVYTTHGKYIDLVIKSVEVDKGGKHQWAIVLENKIYADLYNDLEEYWISVDAYDKQGVVLSVWDVKEQEKLDELLKKDMPYINILHKQLIEVVQKNHIDYFLEADDRHLMYLKEYISNVKSFYPNDNNEMKDMDKVFGMFLNKSEEIKKIVEKDADLLEYLRITFDKLMLANSYGASRYRNKGQLYSFYYYKPEGKLKNNLRFWFNISGFKETGVLVGYYEIYNKSFFEEKDLLLEGVDFASTSVSKGVGEGSGHVHLAHIKIYLRDIISEGFERKFEWALKNEIFGAEWFKNINKHAEKELCVQEVSAN